MPYDTPYNRMIARNQQHTDDEYADYRAYSNQNYLRDGSMGDARGNLRLFPKMAQREYHSPLDYSGGITHRNMEGNGGPLGRQFNSIALGEDTRRLHNKSAMYSPVRSLRYSREDDRHYSSSEDSCSDDEDLDAMYGGGVPNHDQLLKHLAKMKLPADVHQEILEWLDEMEKNGRGLEGRGGLWDWIKSAAKKVGSFVASNIKPIAKFAMPFIKKIPGVGSVIDAASSAAKIIPGASGVLSEYGLGYRGNGEVYVPSAERGNRLTDVKTGGMGPRRRALNEWAVKEGLLANQEKKGGKVNQENVDKYNNWTKKVSENAKKRILENKKGQEALARERAAEAAKAAAPAPAPAPATGSGAKNMMETNENPLIGVPMRKPGYMKSSGLHFEGASLGAGASGGKKRGRPRKVGGSVIGGPSNDPVNRGKITGGKSGSALFKKKGSFPLETKAGEPPTESQIVTNGALGQGLKRGRGPKHSKIVPMTADDNEAKPDPVSPLYRKKAVKKKKVPVTTDSSYVPYNPAPIRPPKNQPGDIEFPHPNVAESGKVASAFGKKAFDKKGGKLKTCLPGSSFSGGKKTSPWIAHCKAYASAHGVSYKQAMKDAKASYRK